MSDPTSDPVRIVLVGATGMVGRQVIERAVGRPDLRLTAVARREVPLPKGARMEMLLSDPDYWADAIAAAQARVAVIALGTTIAAVGGDRDAFRAVDYELVLKCARAAREAGVHQLIAVSSVGAELASRNFYLSVKGQMEDALARLHFGRLDILRPGLLRGRREGAARPGERAAMIASPLTDLFLHGSLRRYRSIPAATVADASLRLAGARPDGRFIHEYDALVRAARRGEGQNGG